MREVHSMVRTERLQLPVSALEKSTKSSNTKAVGAGWERLNSEESFPKKKKKVSENEDGNDTTAWDGFPSERHWGEHINYTPVWKLSPCDSYNPHPNPASLPNSL